jgi:truncated hemoglobin YjbI
MISQKVIFATVSKQLIIVIMEEILSISKSSLLKDSLLTDSSHEFSVNNHGSQPPRFFNDTDFGYITRKFQQMYLKTHTDVEPSDIACLQANPDWSKPLYFWQLYSLLGEDSINAIVSDFYNRIWNDKTEENKWFVQSFTNVVTLDRAIMTQTHMWIDVMGGGAVYHGGLMRLNFHHERVYQVMNDRGAKVWLRFMKETLDSVDFGSNDPRIRPAIEVFLETAMCKYGADFDFSTNDLKYNSYDRP